MYEYSDTATSWIQFRAFHVYILSRTYAYIVAFLIWLSTTVLCPLHLVDSKPLPATTYALNHCSIQFTTLWRRKKLIFSNYTAKSSHLQYKTRDLRPKLNKSSSDILNVIWDRSKPISRGRINTISFTHYTWILH